MREVVITAMVTALVGSGGAVGILFWYLQRYLDKRLKISDDERRSRLEKQISSLKIENKIRHAYGRMFFWLYKAITTGEHNGDLKKAFEELEAAEQEQKEYDYQVLAEQEQKLNY